jgi:Zn-dependent protease with chaperone function
MLRQCLRGGFLIEACTLLLVLQPQTWWIWATLIQFVGTILLHRFLLPWTGRFTGLLTRSLKISRRSTTMVPISEGEIAARFRHLLERLEIPLCDLFILHETSGRARAFFTMRGKRPRVVLTRTLVQTFPLDEAEVILAHELAHLVHHDFWRGLITRTLNFLGLCLLLQFGLFLVLYSPMRDALFPIALDDLPSLLRLEGLILSFLASILLYRGFGLLLMRSRRRQEYLAVEFALQTTGNIPAFKRSMVRLVNTNGSLAAPNKRARYFSTHPTLMERLAHADEFAARHRVSQTTGADK